MSAKCQKRTLVDLTALDFGTPRKHIARTVFASIRAQEWWDARRRAVDSKS